MFIFAALKTTTATKPQTFILFLLKGKYLQKLRNNHLMTSQDRNALALVKCLNGKPKCFTNKIVQILIIIITITALFSSYNWLTDINMKLSFEMSI